MNVLSSLESLAAFALKHKDLISILIEAVQAGVSKETLITLIKAELTALADEQMRKELEPLPDTLPGQ